MPLGFHTDMQHLRFLLFWPQGYHMLGLEISNLPFGIILWELMHRGKDQAKRCSLSYWNQDPNGRPFFKDLLKGVKNLMEMETFPYFQTNIENL